MERWIKDIYACTHLEEIQSVLSAFSDENALDGFAYVIHHPQFKIDSPLYVISNYPKEWADIYVRKKYYLSDPVLTLVKKAKEAFIWSDKVNIENMTDKNYQVMEEASQFNINNGMTVPINNFGNTSLNFLFQGQIDFITQKRAMLISHLAHEHIQTLLKTQGLEKRLTARETECLIWTAIGKTSEEIGLIRGIATRTVNEHINNSMRKLNACNKLQAVMKALLFQEFEFSDIQL